MKTTYTPGGVSWNTTETPFTMLTALYVIDTGWLLTIYGENTGKALPQNWEIAA